MAATMKGMNVEEVTTFATSVESTHLSNIEQAINSLATGAEGLPWQGPDYEAFKGNEVQQIRTNYTTLRGSIEAMIATLKKNATDQDATSAT